MAFPPGFLDQIRTRLPVSAVVGRSVRLQKRGREFVGLSPFSNEKTPSFTVNDQKGFYHCFSSGEHGDIFSFLMKTQSLSFMEAVERLAEEAGLEVPQQSPEERKKADRADVLREATAKAVQFFEGKLFGPEGRAALDYLRGRGLSDGTIKAFHLGYAPKGNALKTALMKASVAEDALMETRLISEGREGRESFDFFRDRVIFPINDPRGRPVAFGGRVMGEGEPKYLNSPETPIFHKGHMLFALDRARGPILDQDQVIVCEGYMDVIALANVGIKNAVAPLGTAITETQVEALWRIAPEPILCFDGDKAGRKAAARAAERMLPRLQPGNSINFALLPEGRDPDDVVRASGAEGFRALLDQAVPMSEIIWRIATDNQSADTPERRAALEARVMELANSIENQTVRSYYQQAMKDRIWSEVRAARPQQSGSARGKSWPPNKPVTGLSGRRPQPIDAATRQSHILLAAVINHPALLDRVDEQLGEVSFPESRLESLRRAVLKHYADDTISDRESLKTALEREGHGECLSMVLSPGLYALHKFVRPEAELLEVETGWHHAFRMFKEGDQKREKETAVQTLGQMPSDRAFETLKALGNQPSAKDDEPLDQ